jgi:Domain of Unknown Function (DUF748)
MKYTAAITAWMPELLHRRWIRRLSITLLVIFVLYSLGGFFGVPPLLRYLATRQVAASLHRPVAVGRIAFNPYTLRLQVDQLKVGEAGAPQPFVAIRHLNVRASWTSLFRLAPIIREVVVDQPAIHVVRLAPQKFNFSDLLEPAAPANAAPATKSSSRFAISNIQVNNGVVHFDDRVLGRQHTVSKLMLGVPFIANLPADTKIFVEPLLEMTVDGSPLRITGQVRPFVATHESLVYLNFERLDLNRYFGYLPLKPPIKLPQGMLSAQIRVYFTARPEHPLLRVTGKVALDELAIQDGAGAHLLDLKHADLTMADVEPLGELFHLASVNIDGLKAHLVLNSDGTTNLTAVANAFASPKAAAPPPASAPSPTVAQPQPSASPTTAHAAASPAASPAPLSSLVASAPPLSAAPSAAAPTPAPGVVGATVLVLDSFQMSNSAADITDHMAAKPASLAIKGLHVGLKNFATNSKTPAPYELAASLGSGGTIAAKGALDAVKSEATTDLSLQQIDLPALQNFVPPGNVNASVSSGKLTANSHLTTVFASGKFNVHAEPAKLALDNVELRVPNEKQSPLGWKHFVTSIAQVDLASRHAAVDEVRAEGLNVLVQRGAHGEINLASLLATPAQSAGAPAPPPSRPKPRPRRRGRARRERTPAAASTPAAGGWQYRIALVAIENTRVNIEDLSSRKHTTTVVAPLNIELKDVSDDFAKPFTLAIEGAVNRRGKFKITGDVALKPLRSKLRINARRVDLTSLDPYVTSVLNARLASAALTINGTAQVESRNDQLRASYRGDATLGRVSVLDKLTGESFLKWYSLSAERIDVRYGQGEPRVHIRSLALSDFYSRIILNRDGHLNLADITTSQQEAPVSLTRTNAGASQSVPAAASGAPVASGPPIKADLEIGGITLQGGQINYTDNFIKPNYTADLTGVGGKVGAFGTQTSEPAEVMLEGKLNDNAPIQISGLINPLAPVAFVDLKTNATDVELGPLSPYSTRYTGYPITRGTLTVDVHYLLNHGELKADNHIVLDQLTFGDRVENSTATNLPIRLAVAILKDPQGKIDLSIPVAGSLSDPQFSLSGLISHAIFNVIKSAITSPFRLLASAVGGSGGQQLSYIVFKPGFATLTSPAQTKLQTLAKALKERPALKLEITGRVDPKRDHDGLREAKLVRAIKLQKLKDQGLKAGGTDLDGVVVTPDEYNRYLRRVYKAADFSKPTNLFGLTKSLPPDEMKKLFITHTKVTDADLRQLAVDRADAIRKYLSKTVAPDRLLVAQPKLNAEGIKDHETTTRADLSLT